MTRRLVMVAIALAAVLTATIAVVQLERQRAGLVVERTTLAASPATVWRPADGGGDGLVVVAHGFAGSRQMMQALSMTLARSGLVVAAFDFEGHGRNPDPMSGDIASLEGTTARLVEQTVAVTRAARSLPGAGGPIALVGHSMGTDVVIRASDRLENVAAVVAISMYSDAVTPDAPERLLMVSGAREGRLREVALDRLRQVDPDAGEGETARAGEVVRRAVAAPYVGHVGVLYSPAALRESRDWIAAAMGVAAAGAPPRTGPWLLGLLGGIVALAWPMSGWLGSPRTPRTHAPLRPVTFLLAPALPAVAGAALVPQGALGLAAFGPLAVFFGIWGLVQLALLWSAGIRPRAASSSGALLLLVWGLGLFAIALDRYGAAFLPSGPRLEVMALVLAGTLPFCLADALSRRAFGLGVRLASRGLAIVALLAAMFVAPRLGIAFTVLPVTVLFWCVYGLAGRWVARRTEPTMTGLALGVILAWAVAASTPLVESGGDMGRGALGEIGDAAGS